MADKESGVYLTITDNSFETPGVSAMVPLVIGTFTKGKLGLNLVNANNFKNIVGYDLKYNPNYYGLNSILQSVSYAYVWRINQGAKLANAYFTSAASSKASVEDAESFEDITKLDPKPILALSLKDVGNPQTTAIKLTPTPDEVSVMNEFATPSTPQEVKFEDVSETETTVYNEKQIRAGCVIYNGANNAIVGIIKPNYDGRLSVYKVIDGEIIDDVMTTVTTNTWSDGTNFYGSDMLPMTEPEGEAGDPVELGKVRKTTYNVNHNTWTLNNKFYDKDAREMTEPAGTAGTGVSLGEAYVADGTEEHLISGIMYITNDVGTTFYTVTELGNTFADSTLVEVPSSETDTLAELTALYTGDSFKEIKYVEYTETKDTGYYKKNLDSWFKALSFSTKMIVVDSVAETDTAIITALEAASDITINYIQYSKEVLTQDNTCGTADWNNTELTLVLTKTLSKDSFWTVRIIPSQIINWKMTVSSYADNQYTVMNDYFLSTDPESTIYWEKTDFGDVNFFVQGNIPSNWAAIRDYFTLDNGSNGDPNIIAADLDLTILEKCKCNVIAMNGITNYKIINRIAQKAETLYQHVFGDAPAYANYGDLENWMKNIYRSEYLAIGARPDQVEIADGEYIYVYPSVNYIKILARMQNNYQSLMYPPAGFTYGTIAVENLIECDYENYGDELKTNRINWQRTKNRGSVMWEQRTTYALSTDLSYIAPNFIVDGLREQILEFEEQFNFRYTSPTDLLNQESGLKAILDDYVTKGFIFKYELDVPSYAEAQKAGRTLTIKIGVAIAKDSEIIIINVNLNNG